MFPVKILVYIWVTDFARKVKCLHRSHALWMQGFILPMYFVLILVYLKLSQVVIELPPTESLPSTDFLCIPEDGANLQNASCWDFPNQSGRESFLAFSPATSPAVRSIMQEVVGRLNNLSSISSSTSYKTVIPPALQLVPFNRSYHQLQNDFYSNFERQFDTMKPQKLFAGVVFENVDEFAPDLPLNLSFQILMSGSRLPVGNLVSSPLASCRPSALPSGDKVESSSVGGGGLPSHCPSQRYATSGFLALQATIRDVFMAKHLKTSIVPPPVKTREEDVPSPASGLRAAFSPPHTSHLGLCPHGLRLRERMVQLPLPSFKTATPEFIEWGFAVGYLIVVFAPLASGLNEILSLEIGGDGLHSDNFDTLLAAGLPREIAHSTSLVTQALSSLTSSAILFIGGHLSGAFHNSHVVPWLCAHITLAAMCCVVAGCTLCLLSLSVGRNSVMRRLVSSGLRGAALVCIIPLRLIEAGCHVITWATLASPCVAIIFTLDAVVNLNGHETWLNAEYFTSNIPKGLNASSLPISLSLWVAMSLFLVKYVYTLLVCSLPPLAPTSSIPVSQVPLHKLLDAILMTSNISATNPKYTIRYSNRTNGFEADVQIDCDTHNWEEREEESQGGQVERMLRVDGEGAVDVVRVWKEVGRPNSRVFGIQDLSFSLRSGQIAAVVGGRGSGKSTLLKLISGVEHPTRGSIAVQLSSGAAFCGGDLSMAVGRCSSSPATWEHLTLLESITYLAVLKKTHIRLDEIEESSIFYSPESLLESLGLGKSIHTRGGKLSDSHLRMAAVAQALVCAPPLVVLDNPAPNGLLEPGLHRAMLDTLRKCIPHQVVVSAWDSVAALEDLSDSVRVVALHRGSLQWCGSIPFLRAMMGIGYTLQVTEYQSTAEYHVTQEGRSLAGVSQAVDWSGGQFDSPNSESRTALDSGQHSRSSSTLSTRLLDAVRQYVPGAQIQGMVVSTARQKKVPPSYSDTLLFEESMDTGDLFARQFHQRGSFLNHFHSFGNDSTFSLGTLNSFKHQKSFESGEVSSLTSRHSEVPNVLDKHKLSRLDSPLQIHDGLRPSADLSYQDGKICGFSMNHSYKNALVNGSSHQHPSSILEKKADSPVTTAPVAYSIPIKGLNGPQISALLAEIAAEVEKTSADAVLESITLEEALRQSETSLKASPSLPHPQSFAFHPSNKQPLLWHDNSENTTLLEDSPSFPFLPTDTTKGVFSTSRQYSTPTLGRNPSMVTRHPSSKTSELTVVSPHTSTLMALILARIKGYLRSPCLIIQACGLPLAVVALAFASERILWQSSEFHVSVFPLTPPPTGSSAADPFLYSSRLEFSDQSHLIARHLGPYSQRIPMPTSHPSKPMVVFEELALDQCVAEYSIHFNPHQSIHAVPMLSVALTNVIFGLMLNATSKGFTTLNTNTSQQYLSLDDDSVSPGSPMFQISSAVLPFLDNPSVELPLFVSMLVVCYLTSMAPVLAQRGVKERTSGRTHQLALQGSLSVWVMMFETLLPCWIVLSAVLLLIAAVGFIVGSLMFQGGALMACLAIMLISSIPLTLASQVLVSSNNYTSSHHASTTFCLAGLIPFVFVLAIGNGDICSGFCSLKLTHFVLSCADPPYAFLSGIYFIHRIMLLFDAFGKPFPSSLHEFFFESHSIDDSATATLTITSNVQFSTPLNLSLIGLLVGSVIYTLRLRSQFSKAKEELYRPIKGWGKPIQPPASKSTGENIMIRIESHPVADVLTHRKKFLYQVDSSSTLSTVEGIIKSLSAAGTFRDFDLHCNTFSSTHRSIEASDCDSARSTNQSPHSSTDQSKFSVVSPDCNIGTCATIGRHPGLSDSSSTPAGTPSWSPGGGGPLGGGGGVVRSRRVSDSTVSTPGSTRPSSPTSAFSEDALQAEVDRLFKAAAETHSMRHVQHCSHEDFLFSMDVIAEESPGTMNLLDQSWKSREDISSLQHLSGDRKGKQPYISSGRHAASAASVSQNSSKCSSVDEDLIVNTDLHSPEDSHPQPASYGQRTYNNHEDFQQSSASYSIAMKDVSVIFPAGLQFSHPPTPTAATAGVGPIDCLEDGTRPALLQFTLGVRPAEAMALVGEHGSGPSVVIQVLSGLVKYSGDVQLLNRPLDESLRQMGRVVGYCPANSLLDGHLSFREHVVMTTTLRGYNKQCNGIASTRPFGDGTDLCEWVLESLGLLALANTLTWDCPHSTRRQLELGLTLLGSPPVILLDEPTQGLDSAAKLTMWSLMRTCVTRGGSTLVIASHSLDDAANVCSKVGFMVCGELKSLLDLHEVRAHCGTEVSVQLLRPRLLFEEEAEDTSGEDQVRMVLRELFDQGDVDWNLSSCGNYSCKMFNLSLANFAEVFTDLQNIKSEGKFCSNNSCSSGKLVIDDFIVDQTSLPKLLSNLRDHQLRNGL